MPGAMASVVEALVFCSLTTRIVGEELLAALRKRRGKQARRLREEH